MKKGSPKKRKLTVLVPEDILEGALESSGEGIAATVTQGLAMLCARKAYKRLRQLRGAVKISIDLDELRGD